MAQFINPLTIGYPTSDQPTAVIPVISSYDWLDPEAYMGRFNSPQDDAAWSIIVASPDKEQHSPTLTHRALRISEELHEVVGYDPRETLPYLEALPGGWWHAPQCSQFVHYNRTDLY